MSILEELEYVNEARKNITLLNNYLVWNGGLIKQMLKDASIRENREFYSAIVQCEEYYNEIFNDKKNVVQYGIVRKEYEALRCKMEKFKSEANISRSPWKQLKRKMDKFLKEKEAIDEHTI